MIETAALSLQQTDVFRAVRRGYAVVNQDVRGRFRSDGSFRPFHQEINDGYDAVECAAAQPWSTGKVGMFGTSYVGATQWLAAVGAPPAARSRAWTCPWARPGPRARWRPAWATPWP